MSLKIQKPCTKPLLLERLSLERLCLAMHLIGVLARAVIPGIEVGDKVMPMLAMDVLPSFLAGLVLAAPMAAIMSTVNALLILVSSTIVKGCLFEFYQAGCNREAN